MGLLVSQGRSKTSKKKEIVDKMNSELQSDELSRLALNEQVHNGKKSELSPNRKQVQVQR